MTSPEFSTLVDLLQYRAAHQPNQTAYYSVNLQLTGKGDVA